MSQKYSEKEILGLVSEAKAQGLSLLKLCLKKGVCPSTVYRRLARLKPDEEVKVFPLKDEAKEIDVVTVKARLSCIDDLVKLLGSL